MELLPEAKETVISRAQSYFDEGYACSQSVLLAYADYFNLDLPTAKRISSTFGGGMGRLRKTCGAVTGAFMVLGLAHGNEDPKDMDTKLNSYVMVRELYHKVEANHGTVNCKELLTKYASENDVLQRTHHKIICRQIVAEVSELLYDQLIKSTEN
ncbi:MAG: C-GCAxxG-C-C family protein [Methylococcaceae bacterium]|nr:C-GCAxxG-C-C family protein [Prolixibacteraceae bacterium]